MNPILVYIFRWLARLTTWCQTRGIQIVDIGLCAVPVVLVLAFIRARILESFWEDNPLTIAGYPSRGITFSATHKENLQAGLGCITIAVVVLLVALASGIVPR